MRGSGRYTEVVYSLLNERFVLESLGQFQQTDRSLLFLWITTSLLRKRKYYNMIPSSRTGWAIWPNLGIAIGRTKNPIRSLEEGWISRSNQKTIVNIKEAWRSSLAGTIRKEMIDDDYMENPKWNCNHNFIEYTKHSSLHGLKYIGQKDLNNCERFERFLFF